MTRAAHSAPMALSRRFRPVTCTRSIAAANSLVANEHDLAGDASLPEQLVRLSRPGKRKPLCDERLNLVLLKEIEQGDQILSKQSRPQPFEPLNAVADHPFPAREKPAASNVEPEDGESTIAMTTTWSQSSAA